MKTLEQQIGLNWFIILCDREFEVLSKYITSHYGIKLPRHKKLFLQSRLQKRLRELGLDSFKEYTEYVFSGQGELNEIPHMIDAICTNTTEFFRERHHFDFLLLQGLNEYFRRNGKRAISIWSAGCASGEEPYSVAMMMKEYLNGNNVDFQILATDISMKVLHEAKVGLYPINKINTIPVSYRKKYLLKDIGTQHEMFRISNELRSKVNFRKFNLIQSDYGDMVIHDIIFCRNVLIYFEKDIQYWILRQLCRQLNLNGYLFLGHSETIAGFELPLRQIMPTVYIKIDE